MFANRTKESPMRNIGLPVQGSSIKSNNLTNCNLCGGLESSVKCDRCDSRTFCISCDDMYHRHPKRRFHLRKPIINPSNISTSVIHSMHTTPLLSKSSSPLSSANVNFHSETRLASPSAPSSTTIKPQSPISQFQTPEAVHHPSKMPIPPPRRKKKSQQDPNRSGLLQLGQTRVFQYQSGSNYRSVDHLNQAGRYVNDSPQQQQQLQHQHQHQQRLNYNYLRPFEEEYQTVNTSTAPGGSNLSSANSSSLSSEQWSSEVGSVAPPALPMKKKWSQSLPRRNLSLVDLTNPYINGNQCYPGGVPSIHPMQMQEQMMINHPCLPPHHPMNYGASPYHHQQQVGPYGMGPTSLAQSMEDLGLDDGDDQASDEDYSDHGTLTRTKSRSSSTGNRRSDSMKRSQSSFLVNSNQWQQQPHQQMLPPYWMNPVYPMYPNYQVMPGGLRGVSHSPLPMSYNNSNISGHNSRSSPSPSLRSLNMNRKAHSNMSREQSVRSSVARESSPGMVRKSSISSTNSSSSHFNHLNRSGHPNSSQSRGKMFDQRSTSIPRSLNSSRYSLRASDSDEDEERGDHRVRRKRADDEDDYASQSEEIDVNDDDDNDEDEEDDRYSQASSLEPNKWWPCYACTYVNKPNSDICEMCGKSHPSRLKKINRGRQTKVIKEKSKEPERPADQSRGSSVVITTDLIREQMEIEKELRRRLENEKRIERENRRLERREEKKRKQSIATSLIDENDDADNDDNGNHLSNQSVPSTSFSPSTPSMASIARKEPVSMRADSMRTNDDFKMRFKTNNGNKKDDDEADDDDDGHRNDINNSNDDKTVVKHSDKKNDDELDWPDSVRKRDSIDKHNYKYNNDNAKEGERSMSPLLSKNFQDIEATFEKLEQEIDSIRNSTNKRDTSDTAKSEPSKEGDEISPMTVEKPSKNRLDQQQPLVTQCKQVDPKRPGSLTDTKTTNGDQNDQVKNGNDSENVVTTNEVKKPVEGKANEVPNQPLITPQQVNQPINQSPQSIPDSPLPLALPTIYQQPQPCQQMFPPYPNPYQLMGQQLTPINHANQSFVGPAGSMFPNYDVNRLRSNSYMGLNGSPTGDLINHPLAVYAGSNYINNPQSVGPSIYHNLPMSANQMNLQMVTDSGLRHHDPNALSYLSSSGNFGGKFISSENLSMDNRNNQSSSSPSTGMPTVSSAQSQLQSGFQMFKLLRDAEKKGFTADDIEIALTFNSSSPLDWLDENWDNMVETVLTLSNNQLVQNEKKRLGKKYKLTAIDLVTTKDAKSAHEQSQHFEMPSSLHQKSEQLTDKSLSRSSSSSGEYFSEPSDDNEDDMVDKKKENVGNYSERLQSVEGKSVGEIEEVDKEKIIEEDEEDKDEEEEEEEEEREDNTDVEDEENEELVRLRSNSTEDDGELENGKGYDDDDDDEGDAQEDDENVEDDKEVEDYENLRRSLEQRLSQLGVNSIDEYVDDSDEDDDEGERKDVNGDGVTIGMKDETDADYEILNRDDFDSNDSDKWSQQSGEFLKQDDDAQYQRSSKERLTSDLLNPETVVECRTIDDQTEQNVNDEGDINKINGKEELTEEKAAPSNPKQKRKRGLHKNKGLTNQREERDQEKQEQNSNGSISNVNQTLLPVKQITDLPVIDKESLNPHFGYARSAYECELCAGSFHIRDMVSMISCTHKACINCLRQYFSVQIREAQVFIITCPFCSEPSISSDDEDSVCDYLSLLDQLVKSLVPADLHELWQRKVRDKVLSKDPSFRWCTNCSSGFIASNPAAKTITCPDCKIVNCASCHKIWEEQHTGITCEQFTEWKRLNDPEYSDNQLELHLKQFGIDCPNCHFHYELSKGGCMHFHCVQCSHDFCGGCRQPFRLGSKCKVSTWCDKLGLHAHHPRNCLFYLRDKEVNELRKLLDIHQIEYKYNDDKQSTTESRVCMVMEQKECPQGLKDMPCGNNLETAGVCKQHYIEYLGGLIFQHGIDPIEIFTEDELIHVLRRANVNLPVKKNGQDYRNILCEIISKECPLIKDSAK